ncbi:MAG: hypothetical protein V1846_05040 [Candidatus Komeilibacteria bacterium]
MSAVVLVIEPTSDNYLSVYLLRGNKLHCLRVAASKLDQALLPLIDKVLKRNKVKPIHLSAIGLVQSPMSLASQRLAVSVVNSLGWAWGVPVFAHHGVVTVAAINKSLKKARKVFIKAEYSSKPRIGKSKNSS